MPIWEDTGATRLDPDVRLQRLPDLRLTLTGAGTVRVKAPSGASIECGHLGLRILERFKEPTSLREFASERAAGTQEWIDLLESARSLITHGVLVDPEKPRSRQGASRGYWWDDPRPHIEMLDDQHRTSSFIEAIQQTVRPGDIVIDIGTGTGVLAMAAARAGAKRVYAIEAGAIADKAEKIVAANGFEDTISVLRGWSSVVSVPERADVLVTETIGSDPFNERILEIVIDARERLLTPGATIIPEGIALHGTPVEVPEATFADWVYTREGCSRWQAAYGFDFGQLVAHERWVRGIRVPMATARSWRPLARSVLLADVVLASADTGVITSERRVHAATSGRLDGAFLHFVARLASGISISTDPHAQEPASHWWNVLHLRPPVDIELGQHLQLTYGRNSPFVERGLTVTFPG